MPGLNDTDILLDAQCQLTQAAGGDAPIASGLDCLVQDIRLEAMTQEGDLFYDTDWGWSLLDFIQSEDDELTIIEAAQRVRQKLEKREVIDPDTIAVRASFAGDTLIIFTSFRFWNDEQQRSLTISVERVSVEVITV